MAKNGLNLALPRYTKLPNKLLLYHHTLSPVPSVLSPSGEGRKGQEAEGGGAGQKSAYRKKNQFFFAKRSEKK